VFTEHVNRSLLFKVLCQCWGTTHMLLPHSSSTSPEDTLNTTTAGWLMGPKACWLYTLFVRNVLPSQTRSPRWNTTILPLTSKLTAESWPSFFVASGQLSTTLKPIKETHTIESSQNNSILYTTVQIWTDDYHISINTRQNGLDINHMMHKFF
jgi:hypothetical protein